MVPVRELCDIVRAPEVLPDNKKVKLATLKFYKVDGNGNVERLRKICPQCPGAFMAKHFDRNYCGLCGLTYVYQQES